jgi:hypothetical protein
MSDLIDTYQIQRAGEGSNRAVYVDVLLLHAFAPE